MTPPKFTVLSIEEKFAPVTVTAVPIGPLEGVRLVMWGWAGGGGGGGLIDPVTVNSHGFEVPPVFETVTLTVLGNGTLGTANPRQVPPHGPAIMLGITTPPKFTVLPVGVKFAPVTVTAVPTGPLEGVRFVMYGWVGGGGGVGAGGGTGGGGGVISGD